MKMRSGILAGVALLATAAPAYADVVYNLTLTSMDGYPGGSGSFALNVAPPAVGTVNYAFSPSYHTATPGYLLDSFTVTLQVPGPPVGATYPITPSFGGYLQYLQSVNGVLSFIGFSYQENSYAYSENFGVGSTDYSYASQYLENGMLVDYRDAGTVSISPAIAATPEPGSFALLGTGVLAGVGLVRRTYPQR